MKFGKKTLILIIVAALAICGVAVVNYYPESPISSQPASSTVYIENGVSGIVTVTDPVLNKTVDININYYPLDSGSGLIVTQDGYIITAYHVVGDPGTLQSQAKLKKMEDNDVKLYLERAALTYYISNQNPQLVNELIQNSSGNMISNFQEVDIATLTNLFIAHNWLQAKSYHQVIKVKFPSSVGIDSLEARLVDVGDSATYQDVALLKVEPGIKILPALGISSKKPVIGEDIRIYGYPKTGGAMQYQINQSSPTTSSDNIPSVTTGSLVSETPTSFGTVYHETTANTSGGYSGGPVFDSQNNVIGILIYGIETRQRFSRQMEGGSLFLSSDYIIELCNKNNVPIKVV